MYYKDVKETLFQVLDEVKPNKIALNYSEEDVAADGLSHGLYTKLMKDLKEYGYQGEIVSAETLIIKLRGRKTEEEYKSLMKAIEITEKIFEDAKSFITAGVSQIDIHRWFVERTKYYGCETSWQEVQCPGVMLGPDTVMGHNAPTELAAKPGDVITVDFGVKIDDYCSDVQRVYYILKDGETDAPEHVKEAFKRVQDSVDVGMKDLKPGADPVAVDQAARENLLSFGYPNFPFGFGHQVGRKTHDGGISLSPKCKIKLPVEESMVFTVDLNVRTDRGIVGQEDMAYVTKDGCKLMTTRQDGLYLVK
jgi:Xaa-Pro aminopeptidase